MSSEEEQDKKISALFDALTDLIKATAEWLRKRS